MKKDFKIGLGVGLLFVVGVAFWLSTRPNFSTEARAIASYSAKPSNSPDVYQGLAENQTPNTARQTLPAPSAPPAASEEKTNAEQSSRIYIVQKGDTLSAISAKYYGTPLRWQKIVTANPAALSDPNRLIPGARLVIPE